MAFRALPRPQFAQLQTATFPIYFSLQAGLPVLVALTSTRHGQPNGLSGLFTPGTRCGTLIPMATVMVTGLVNMFILRPLTTGVMRERKHQGMLFFDYLGDCEERAYAGRNSRREEEL